MQRVHRRIIILAAALVFSLTSVNVSGQSRGRNAEEDGRSSSGGQSARGAVRSVTIPITLRGRGVQAPLEVPPAGEMFLVREDGEAQRILSIRAISNAPLSVAILIQDDLVSSIGNEIKVMAEFIRRLPRGSRVMIGYIRTGSLQVSQRFTADLEKAAAALRVPLGVASAAPFNPYVEIREGLKRFEPLPTGRRALLVVSDGLDTSRGLDSSVPSLSTDLDRAIKEAQREGVAVYSFFAPSIYMATTNNRMLINNGLSSLEKLSEETGGQAYFQGTGAPVSFDPFLRELAASFTRQLALTYLSTHPNKGYHRIEVKSGLPDVEIDHPAGYTR